MRSDRTKNSPNLSYILLCLLIALGLALTGAGLYFGYYDGGAHLWQNDAPWIATAWPYLLTVLAVVIGGIVAFALTRRHKDKTTEPGALPASLPAQITAAVLVLILVVIFIAQLAVLGTDDPLAVLFTARDGEGHLQAFEAAFFHVVSMVFLLPASLWFVAPALKKKRPVAASCLFLLFLAALVFRLYFDMSLHLNNPRRTLEIFALLAAMIAVCGETSRLIKKENYKLFAFAAPLAMILTFSCGLSTLILNIAGKVQDGVSLIYGLFEIGLAVWFALSLASLLKSVPVLQEEHAKTAKETAAEEAAEEAIEEAREERAEPSADPSAKEATESSANTPTEDPTDVSAASTEPTPTAPAEETAEPSPEEAPTETAAPAAGKATDAPAPADEVPEVSENGGQDDAPAAEAAIDQAPLSAEEVKAFYRAVCAVVARQMGKAPDEAPDEEVRKNANAIVTRLVSDSGDDPAEVAAKVRAFLARGD